MATDPPRDLTADRAAATLLGRMGLVGHPADAQFIGDILEFRRQTRQDALREAAQLYKDWVAGKWFDEMEFQAALDRLASEEG